MFLMSIYSIVILKGKAVGVMVAKSGGNGEKYLIRADAVVSSAGVRNTFLNLLPREVASKTEIYKKVRLL